jgi:dihydrofolate reductase
VLAIQARLLSSVPRRPATEISRRCRIKVPLFVERMRTEQRKGTDMTAIYTWDVFSTLDAYGTYNEDGDWGGYWSKQGPELLAHRAALFDTPQRMVFGATTFRENAEILTSGLDPHSLDEWNVRTFHSPATVISSTLTDTLGWPDATIVSGDAVDIVTRLKEGSEVPLRSQASLSLNWALMAAGLVDRLQVTIFPVISGRTGATPILGGAGDFDLELLESRTLDRNIQELVYRPTVH